MLASRELEFILSERAPLQIRTNGGVDQSFLETSYNRKSPSSIKRSHRRILSKKAVQSLLDPFVDSMKKSNEWTSVLTDKNAASRLLEAATASICAHVGYTDQRVEALVLDDLQKVCFANSRLCIHIADVR